MKYSKESGKSMILSGWSDTVQKHNLKEDDVCVFKFRDERISSFRDPTASLKLIIHVIPL
jgi:hypothetical protein